MPRAHVEAHDAVVEEGAGPLAEARRPPRRSNAKTRLVTAPVEVITTTITTWGCSSSTSTWRTDEVCGAGAVTMPSRLVTWATTSARRPRAASTSRCISPRSSADSTHAPAPAAGGSRVSRLST